MTDNEMTQFRTLIAKRQGTVTNAATSHRAPIAAALQARLDAGKAALAAAEARAQAKIAAAAIQPAVQPALTTAEEWRAQNAPPTLSRAEWKKLNHLERGQFFQKGGKLAP